MCDCLQIVVWISIIISISTAAVYGTEAQEIVGREFQFLNVDKVWRENKITGKNVVVAVLDDGVSYNHQDLKKNYNHAYGYDFVGNDTDPLPDLKWPWTSHGTQCAGVIAAKMNGRCRTGIAYNANLTGIRIFSTSSKGEDHSASGLGYKKENIDIYSNSWGPNDNGYSTSGPTLPGKKALKYGAFKGRSKRGSIFVFPSGNGGFFGDSCAFDGYVNSIYTVAIAAVTKTGTVPRYAESCSAVIASTYGDNVKTCDVYNGCNERFGKTSSAAAFGSGIIALLLEANNKLTWRDVQHLIIRTSNPKKANINSEDWMINGAGLMVHPSVGFGVMNAKKLVDVAQNWKTKVRKQIICSFKQPNITETIPNRDGILLDLHLPHDKKSFDQIKFLEHVQVEVSVTFSPRANLLMYLISPEGTRSQLLYQRVFDAITRRKHYIDLTITSLHFWGENPTARDGAWRILFKAATFRRPSKVQVRNLKFIFYGTVTDPLSSNTIPTSDTISCVRRGKTVKLWKGYGLKCCGSWVYDPKNENCCSKTNKIVKKNLWCGGKIYNKCESLCCDGVLHNVTDGEQMFCCGQEKYDKKTHGCCGGSTKYRLGHERCCGNDKYLLGYEGCCGGNTKYTLGHESCCGNDKYRVADEGCCGGHVKYSKQFAGCCGGSTKYRLGHERCCGNDKYLLADEGCCGGKKYRLTYEGCCGGNTKYKLRSESCCGNDKYGMADEGCCGGNVKYSKRFEGCCGGNVKYSKQFEDFCGGEKHDTYLFKWDSYTRKFAWHKGSCLNGQNLRYYVLNYSPFNFRICH